MAIGGISTWPAYVFLVERIGLEGFRALYEAELSALRATQPAPLEIRPFPQREASAGQSLPARNQAPAFYSWFDLNVAPQKQVGFYVVHVPLLVGDLTSEAASDLAGVVSAHGDGILRATQSQNVSLRWVSESELAGLFDKLDAIGLAAPEVPVLRDLVACAGASTCRLGICLSRGLAKAVRQELSDSEIALEKLGNLRIHISGCPNSCGRHPVGDIGFSGAARRVDGRTVPYYAVQVGGRLGEGQTRLGTNVGALPARNAPVFVQKFLQAWQSSPHAADFDGFVDNGGIDAARCLVESHAETPVFKQQKEFFIDWDASKDFSLSGRGAGECSAGVFDLIEIDLANARESLEAGRLYAATVSAARSLLVTQSLQPKTDLETFVFFLSHFIGKNLVDSALTDLIEAGLQSASAPNPEASFHGTPSAVTALVASMRVLYESLDSSLRFPKK